MRALGSRQRGFLRWTVDLGPWPRSGWTWGSASNGQRVADSLVKRGLLERHTGEVRGIKFKTYPITDAGRRALEETS